MLKQYFFCSFLFLSFHLSAQSDILYPHLFPDSTIVKHKIRSITENGFGNVKDTLPWWITTEIFDTKNRITKRITINTDMWDSEETFSYQDKKQRIKKQAIHTDYNPSRRNTKRDTVITRYKKTYNFAGRRVKWPFYKDKYKKKEVPEAIIQYQYDTLGRIIESREEAKYGQSIQVYTYNKAGQISTQKSYAHHRNDPERKLMWIEELEYNAKGQVRKVSLYSQYLQLDEGRKHQKETVTTYAYNDRGLLLERAITDKYLNTKNKAPLRKRYAYLYDYY